MLLVLLLLCMPLLGARAQPLDASCAPAACGGLTITYPFWLRGHHEPNCGYPTFGVTCDDPTGATAPTLSESYLRLLDISYGNRSVVAFHNSLVAASDDPCRATRFNVSSSLALSPLAVSGDNWELFFCNNCSRAPPPPAGSLWLNSCSGTVTDAWSVHIGRRYEARPAGPAECKYSVVPVLPRSELRAWGDYAGIVERGFLLEWTVPGDCAACSETGGGCRYEAGANAFGCLCHGGRMHPATCGDYGDSGKTSIKFIIVGAVAGFAAFLAFVLFALYQRKKSKQTVASNEFMRSGSSMTSYSKDLELGGSPHIFTFEELEVATDGFSASRELGDGGFGTVYKGKLKDGRVVAVKRLYKNNYRRVEQFLNEVDILSRLLHQNLVILYGCTSRMSRDLLLVYEFIANGTVADHLHGSHSAERGLTWPLRLNIAIETAEALAYLHAVEIIHRDVKTTNILLDNNFHVKVADFGLSRLFPLEVTHVSTVPQGTPGYVDPVYHQCYKLTDKSDVYSFGVVLVELISSKPAVDMSRSQSEINLANMALNRIQNHEVFQLVDPELGYDTDPETKRTIDRVAEVAFQCLQMERDLRPSIKEVVEILTYVRDGDYRAKSMKKKASQKEDAHLLTNDLQFSPDSVIHRFHSQSTNHSVASNASGL
ncbi:hypothetical protein CFC21_033582 [Triticum aestivum]|uniref:non-specific serine/threonine protein kinase n=2 Tax=Triticum aestivum TaxID=4565 RepID=A0A3B6E9I2_WHEAT|nr:hypothetical protein CFC21_033582 [Triticum aestivum]